MRPSRRSPAQGTAARAGWPGRRLIIEIDGPQYHRFPDEDARKERSWVAAGYEVRRITSDAVYDDHRRLVALARG